MIRFYRIITIIFFLSSFSASLFAQNRLETKISIHVNSMDLHKVLYEISQKANFIFSYNSDILPRDSTTTLHYNNTIVKIILDKILGENYEYIENGKYVVIVKNDKKKSSEIQYISGYVIDSKTNNYIANASVYDMDHLESALTNKDGFFRLKIKENNSQFRCIISKDFYTDKIITNKDINRRIPIKVYLNPQEIGHLEPIAISNNIVEKTWLARALLPYKQMIQSLNIKNFFVNKPFQLSLVPSFGTHGSMSGQVKNKISVNMIGGYSGATHGVELGGVFNIVKQDVNGVQIAGIFNIVGQEIKGVQIAGIYNEGLSSFDGVQIAGIFNRQMKHFRGVQLSGIYNLSQDSMLGIQLSGLWNNAKKTMHGLQFSGLSNTVEDSLHGWQISPIYNNAKRDVKGVQLFALFNKVNGAINGLQFGMLLNHAKILHGAQVGLINIADSSDGFSFGIVNFGKNYSHAFSVFTTELMPYNFAYKSGNPKLYNIITFGISTNASNRQYSFGYGLGKSSKISKRLSIESELTSQSIHFENSKKSTLLIRFQPSLNWSFNKHFKLFAGPSYTWWNKINVSKSTDKTITNGFFPLRIDNKNSWIAGQIGLTIF